VLLKISRILVQFRPRKAGLTMVSADPGCKCRISNLCIHPLQSTTSAVIPY
jgi:hypothetical protein